MSERPLDLVLYHAELNERHLVHGSWSARKTTWTTWRLVRNRYFVWCCAAN